MRSRALTVEHLGPDDPRVPRADTGLAEVMIALGRSDLALSLAERALTARSADFQRNPSEAAWRRLSLTRTAHALALTLSGRPQAGHQAARSLLSDREERLSGDQITGPLLEARWLVGVAMVEQGWLSSARDLLRGVVDDHLSRGEGGTAITQRALTTLCRCLLLLGRPREVAELLRTGIGCGEWFAERVSFRISCAQRLLLAETLLAMGEPTAETEATIAAVSERLHEHHIEDADILRLDAARVRAQLIAVVDPHAAISSLYDVDARFRAAGWQNQLALLVLRCDLAGLLVRVGQVAEAQDLYQQIEQLPDIALERSHPVRLAALAGLAAQETLAGRSAPTFLQPRLGELRLDPRHPISRTIRAMLGDTTAGDQQPEEWLDG
jgi:hypothetical protein